jgi:SNF2 family DNA or RNA helicase
VGRGGEGIKLERLLEDVEGALAEGRKMLIYSQFTSMLELIAREFDKKGWPHLRLEGSTPAAARAECVRRFQEDSDRSLFLLSLKAGGVGLNLTAADYVLLFDPWWNEAVERQAVDRAHRIGQRRSVFIKRYLVCNSIEEKMLALKQKKNRLAEQVLDFENVAESLDPEDLFAFL